VTAVWINFDSPLLKFLAKLDSEDTSWYFEFMAPVIEIKDMSKTFPDVKAPWTT